MVVQFALSAKRTSFLVLLACLIGLPNQAPAAAGNALYAPCAACHGQKGEGNRALGTPNIAGMDAWYVNKQLEDFSLGRRGSKPGDTYGSQMRAMAGTLATPADRVAVSNYIAQLPKTTPAPPPKSKVKPNLANGATQFNALCSSCHNASGKGNKALGAPRLVGVDSVYLARQYSNFRTGKRGTDPNDKYGKQMAAISKLLDAKAEQDVLAYINTLKP
jgi:cbb3-type cytochrome c oxidase subunit III